MLRQLIAQAVGGTLFTDQATRTLAGGSTPAGLGWRL
jgi:hypothetical protein